MTPRIELPRKLIPVFSGMADVRGAYGGRGSGSISGCQRFDLHKIAAPSLFDLHKRRSSTTQTSQRAIETTTSMAPIILLLPNAARFSAHHGRNWTWLGSGYRLHRARLGIYFIPLDDMKEIISNEARSTLRSTVI
jgi:hypothetical protein